MRVLVAFASRYGATAEIAGEMGTILASRRLEACVLAAEEVATVDDFDAVVLGGAVYAGHWLKSAHELVDRNAHALAKRPVWLFSSGPLGEPPKPREDPVDVAEVIEATSAREHKVFAGKLDKSRLGFGERAIVLALRVPGGDYRDWDEVRQWTLGIADALRAAEPA